MSAGFLEGFITNNSGNKKKSYRLSMLIAVLILASLIFLILVFVQASYYKKAKSDALSEAKTILTIKKVDRLVYSDIINKLVESNVGVSTSHDHKGYPLRAANPATYHFETCEEIGKELENFLGCTIFSEFSWKTSTYKQSLDYSFQSRALEHLRSSIEPYYEFISQSDGSESVLYTEPMLMKQSCVDCHNNHSLSPVNDINNPIPAWKVGQPRGMEAVAVKLNVKRDHFFETIFAFLCLIILSLIMFSYFMRLKEQHNYRLLSLDEHGIDNLLNRKNFDDAWDNMCSSKVFSESNNVLVVSFYIRNFKDLSASGDDCLIDVFKELTQIGASNGLTLGRYQEHIITGVLQGNSLNASKSIASNIFNQISHHGQLQGADIQTTGIFFMPHAVHDCKVIYSRIEKPLFNKDGFNFVDFTKNNV